MPHDVIIRLRDVHKAFGDKVVLDGVDLDIPRGRATVIIGGSGTGKSVLLKHMIGLLRPDQGTVEVDRVDLASLNNKELTRFRSRFGMAFQEGALFDSMTVYENVEFPLRRQQIGTLEERRARVAECLSLVRLEGVEHKTPGQLSGGMRRRVGFARAIAHRPAVLLFDEPTTGLDPVTKDVIDELIVKLKETLGSTTITITHDMESVFQIADRVGMLYGGKVIAWAPPQELARLDDPRVQAFLGRSQVAAGGREVGAELAAGSDQGFEPEAQ